MAVDGDGPGTDPAGDDGQEAEHAAPNPALYAAYQSHATTLRAWLVAYGIGGPVLMLTNERLSKAIAESGHAGSLAFLFLLGVTLQVALAALNKYAMWLSYYAELNPDVADTRRHQAAVWVSGQVWIDLVLDAGSLAVFAWATYRILVDVAKAT